MNFFSKSLKRNDQDNIKIVFEGTFKINVAKRLLKRLRILYQHKVENYLKLVKNKLN